jgi:hypothetical protein
LTGLFDYLISIFLGLFSFAKGISNVNNPLSNTNPTFFWNYINTSTNDLLNLTPPLKSLYIIALKRILNANIASKLLNSCYKNKIVAILWHQGEFNEVDIFNNTSKEPIYKRKLVETLTNLRSVSNSIVNDFNINPTDIPILLGGLKSEPARNSNNNMTRIIKDICNENSFKFVPSNNELSNVLFNNRKIFNHNLLGNIGDIYHFSETSQMEFGKRYFYIYNNNSILDIISNSPSPFPNPVGGRKNKTKKLKKRTCFKDTNPIRRIIMR